MLKRFFEKRKRQKEINRRISEWEKEHTPKNPAELMAEKTCRWVELLWNGEKQKFLIYQINFLELLHCGRFPNVVFQFINNIAKEFENPEATEKADLQRFKEEREEFLIELAERSMVMPTYRECYDAILKMRNIKEDDTSNVIPSDFLQDLFLFYITEIETNLKKNSAVIQKSISRALEGSQNTGASRQANTSKG